MKKEQTDSRISNDRIRDIGEHSPDVAHAPAELLGAASGRENVALSCVQTTDEGADTRTCAIVSTHLLTPTT